VADVIVLFQDICIALLDDPLVLLVLFWTVMLLPGVVGRLFV
jgi:hypothetical protein